MVSPGLAPEQGQASSARHPLLQQEQSVAGLLGALQATTVAVVFPSTFCSVNRGAGGSSKDGLNSSSGSSAFGLLQSLLHELGHALHFLLSASGSPDPAAAGGHRSSLEVMETASHLTERMACNATCLQVRSARESQGLGECVGVYASGAYGSAAPVLGSAGTLLHNPGGQ